MVSGVFTAVDDYALADGDVIVDASLYQRLQQADWDAADDAVIDGKRYHRINGSTAVEASTNREQHYRWGEVNEWHYFTYEPIKPTPILFRMLTRIPTGVLATCDSGLTAYSCRLPSVVRKGMPFLKHILRMPPIATLIHPAVLTPKTMCSSCPAMRCSPRQRLLITDSMPAVGLTTLPAASAAHSMPSVAVPGGRLWKVIAATLFG